MVVPFLQKWHPDKHKGDSAASEKFIEINDAYNGKSLPFAPSVFMHIQYKADKRCRKRSKKQNLAP